MKHPSDSTSSWPILEKGLRVDVVMAGLAIVCMTLVLASVAQAAPTQVSVRIEGKSETLFEGPIWTEGHDLKAASEDQQHPCDGTNEKRYAAPGPTPTAAAADAMRIVGETFDGQWYPGYDDYFLTRWGPDEQSVTEDAYWGVLVNDVFTNVGGCQYELSTGAEVLWVYDAFASKPVLALLPAGDASGTRPLTATAELGKPFGVEVLDYSDSTETVPPSTPQRNGSSPFPGAKVSPVRTSPRGFEKVETENRSTVTTDAQGKASITFTTPGWHRLKAVVVSAQGVEEAARSNRLDVCVPSEGESTCEDTPREDLVRTPPSIDEGEEISLPIGPTHIPPTETGSPVNAQPSGSQAPPSSSVSPALLTMPFGGVAPRKSGVARSTKSSKRPVARKPRRARCVRMPRRRTASHRRAPRRCKIAGTLHTKPKRRPRLRRRGRLSHS
jgi:hypothetical protein